MATFNTPAAARADQRRQRTRAGVTAALTTTSPVGTDGDAAPDALTHEGGAAFTKTPLTELFTACTAGFLTENSFYETGDERVARVRELTRQIATGLHGEDAVTWLVDFVTWLRAEGNMRTAPLVLAAEAVHARGSVTHVEDDVSAETAAHMTNGKGFARRIVDAALQRADEPGEFVAYWFARFTDGQHKRLPKPVRRGLADAAARLYTEYSALKYDTGKPGTVRFGDVIMLAHPKPPVGKSLLWQWLIERRPQPRREGWTPRVDEQALRMVYARKTLERIPAEQRRGMVTTDLVNHGGRVNVMREAGITWEWLSGWLNDGKGMDADAWKAVLPTMGYMARLRNLRNLDEAGVDDATAQAVADQLADPDQVARSRQFPFRFLSAYANTHSDRWRMALGRALDASVRNIPELDGDTLIMVDTSGSMEATLSDKSSMSRVGAAALFGIALALRNTGRARLFGFADHEYEFDVIPGSSVLRQVESFSRTIGKAGHGTAIESSTIGAFGRCSRYDVNGKTITPNRVIIFSDMQTFGDRGYGYGYNRARRLGEAIPPTVPIYAFDLAGYATTVIPSGVANRYQLAGLTDATFRQLPQIEAGATGRWPWQDSAG